MACNLGKKTCRKIRFSGNVSRDSETFVSSVIVFRSMGPQIKVTSIHKMIIMTSFAITLYGQCCRLHLVSIMPCARCYCDVRRQWLASGPGYRMVVASGRLPSWRIKPTGSFTAWIWARFMARQMISFVYGSDAVVLVHSIIHYLMYYAVLPIGLVLLCCFIFIFRLVAQLLSVACLWKVKGQ